MAEAKRPERKTAFKELGYRNTIATLLDEISLLYQEDDTPWVVGYSGGKDSSAVLQLVWTALAQLPEKKRHKPVRVISTDTLVESPVISSWVKQSVARMIEAAREQGLPVEPHLLMPEISDSFWVNLIGRGYPAPRHKFRWCTERLKIKPSNKFIMEVVKNQGRAILVLGTRKAESSVRRSRMEKLEKERVYARLSPNESLPNSLVFSPIEDWSNDDVWMYLTQEKNPWGHSNKDLLGMYQGATADGECPLVVDTSTPSCGDSRFGCWVCTLVDKDKSLEAMIRNDEEKEWMLPLLDFRNDIDFRTDEQGNLNPDSEKDKRRRDFRRMSGRVQLFHDKPVHGPYLQETRAHFLRRLLKAQQWIRNHGPKVAGAIELIRPAELEEIRRIWVMEKREVEDLLPSIYREEMGDPYPFSLDDNMVFGREEMALLQELCAESRLMYEMNRDLLEVERRNRTKVKRVGIINELEEVIRRCFYEDAADATEMARIRESAREAADPTLKRAKRLEKIQTEEFTSSLASNHDNDGPKLI